MPIDTQALLSLLGGATRGYQAGQAAKEQQALTLAQLQQKAQQADAENQNRLDVARYESDQRLAGQKYGADQRLSGVQDTNDTRGDLGINGDLIKVYDALGKGDLSTGDAIAMIGGLRQRSRAASGGTPALANGAGVSAPGSPGALPAPKPVGLNFGPNASTGPAVTAPPAIGLPATGGSLPAAPGPPPATPTPPVAAPQTSASAAPSPLGSTVIVPRPIGDASHMGPAQVVKMNKTIQDTKTSGARMQNLDAKTQGQQITNDTLPQMNQAKIQHYQAGTAMDLATAQALAQTTPAKIAQIRNSTLAVGVKLQQDAQRIALQAKQVQIQQQNADTAAGNLGVSRWKAHNPIGRSGAPAKTSSRGDQQ